MISSNRWYEMSYFTCLVCFNFPLLGCWSFEITKLFHCDDPRSTESDPARPSQFRDSPGVFFCGISKLNQSFSSSPLFFHAKISVFLVAKKVPEIFEVPAHGMPFPRPGAKEQTSSPQWAWGDDHEQPRGSRGFSRNLGDLVEFHGEVLTETGDIPSWKMIVTVCELENSPWKELIYLSEVKCVHDCASLPEGIAWWRIHNHIP